MAAMQLACTQDLHLHRNYSLLALGGWVQRPGDGEVVGILDGFRAPAVLSAMRRFFMLVICKFVHALF